MGVGGSGSGSGSGRGVEGGTCSRLIAIRFALAAPASMGLRLLLPQAAVFRWPALRLRVLYEMACLPRIYGRSYI